MNKSSKKPNAPLKESQYQSPKPTKLIKSNHKNNKKTSKNNQRFKRRKSNHKLEENELKDSETDSDGKEIKPNDIKSNLKQIRKIVKQLLKNIQRKQKSVKNNWQKMENILKKITKFESNEIYPKEIYQDLNNLNKLNAKLQYDLGNTILNKQQILNKLLNKASWQQYSLPIKEKEIKSNENKSNQFELNQINEIESIQTKEMKQNQSNQIQQINDNELNENKSEQKEINRVLTARNRTPNQDELKPTKKELNAIIKIGKFNKKKIKKIKKPKTKQILNYNHSLLRKKNEFNFNEYIKKIENESNALKLASIPKVNNNSLLVYLSIKNQIQPIIAFKDDGSTVNIINVELFNYLCKKYANYFKTDYKSIYIETGADKKLIELKKYTYIPLLNSMRIIHKIKCYIHDISIPLLLSSDVITNVLNIIPIYKSPITNIGYYIIKEKIQKVDGFDTDFNKITNPYWLALDAADKYNKELNEVDLKDIERITKFNENKYLKQLKDSKQNQLFLQTNNFKLLNDEIKDDNNNTLLIKSNDYFYENNKKLYNIQQIQTNQSIQSIQSNQLNDSSNKSIELKQNESNEPIMIKDYEFLDRKKLKISKGHFQLKRHKNNSTDVDYIDDVNDDKDSDKYDLPFIPNQI